MKFIAEYSFKENFRRKCYFIVCLITCFLVSLVCLVAKTIVSQGSLIFLMIGERDSGEMDFYITPVSRIRNSSYYSCVFWYQIGLLLIGIIFLCIKGFRVPFIKAVKNNGKRYLFLNITNETINLVANALFNFANLTAPVALLNVLNGFQGAFAFILGVLGTIFIPKYIKEDLSKKVVIQKVICIILSIIGLIVLVYE